MITTIALFIFATALAFGIPTLVGAPYQDYTANWYKQLRRPKLAAPDKVFIVVFPLFYLLETIGLFLMFTSALDNKEILIGLFLISAFLSGVWSRLFFGWQQCKAAIATFVVEIPVGIALVYLLFMQGSIAWLFFLPRVLWGFYAIIPNIQFYTLNKSFWNRAVKDSNET